MIDELKSEARNYRQWYLRDNFYARNVLHPVGDIFGTQLDVHAIEIKAYTDLLAKHERVLQMLEIAEKAVNRSRELFAYCAGPTRDVKTGKLLDGARICSDALAEIESLK